MSSILKRLHDRAWFIVYGTAPRAGSPGKLDKFPVDPQTGHKIDGQDPANWMLPDIALAWAAHLGVGFGVGIVIHKGSNLFALDIDGCLLPDGTWHPFAVGLINRFPAAAREVSLSQTGLHAVGSHSGDIPVHGTQCFIHGIKLECYTEKRFIALTDSTGDPLADCTAELSAMLLELFPPTQAKESSDWTDEPAVTWDGPDDDDVLLAKALRSSSARSRLGKGGATFSDLWNNNVEALAREWPSQSLGKDYDGSSADQALANHLAFYTGNHCERMLTLMRASALARPKWDRPDYLRATILQACGWQKEFYNQAPATTTKPIADQPSGIGSPGVHTDSAEPGAPHDSLAPAPPATELGQLITIDGQKILFAGCVYVQDVHQILMPAPVSVGLDHGRFDAHFSGRRFQIHGDNSRPSESAWDTFINNHVHEFPKVRAMYFEPREAPGTIIIRDGLRKVNSWLPINTPYAEGDPTPFVEHIKKLFPLGNDALILTSYLAGMVQYKGYKARWAPFIQGTPGNGKSIINQFMAEIIGKRYSGGHRSGELASRFNSSFYGKLFIHVDDVLMSEGDAKVWELMKVMITEPTMEIEAKGVDAVTREVCFNFIFNSNHKDGIRKTSDDRRICSLFSAQQCKSDKARDGMGGDYFPKLAEWKDAGGYGIVHHYLATFQIPHEYDFTKGAIEAPDTSSTREAIGAGLSTLEQEVVEAIQTDRRGFKGGWIASTELDGLLRESGRSVNRNKRRQVAENLGYMVHPGLPDGRLTIKLTNSTVKPRLYVTQDHTSAGLTDQKMIRELYERAQTAE